LREAAGAKEIAECGAALFGKDAFGDLDSVVEGGMIDDAKDRAAGPGFGIAGGEDQACDAGMEDGAGAHRARFEGAEERAAFAVLVEKAIVVEDEAGRAQGDDLGVGGGVGEAEDLVVAARDYVA